MIGVENKVVYFVESLILRSIRKINKKIENHLGESISI